MHQIKEKVPSRKTTHFSSFSIDFSAQRRIKINQKDIFHGEVGRKKRNSLKTNMPQIPRPCLLLSSI